LYGFVLLMAALSWIPLSRALIACNGGKDSRLAQAIRGRRGDWKATVSPILYVAGIVLALLAPIDFPWPAVSCGLYALVAALWLIPDQRIEKNYSNS
jgi:hypothetical protein